MIEFSETKFIRIEGNSVALDVASDEDAKAALKELRHKKREYQLLKRKLNAAIKEVGKSQNPKARGRKKPNPAFDSPVAFVGHSLYAVGELVHGLVADPADGTRPLSLAELEERKSAVETTLLHLDEAILHIQGKL